MLCPLPLGSLGQEPVLESTPWKGWFPWWPSPFLVQGLKYLSALKSELVGPRLQFILGHIRPSVCTASQ